MEQNQEKANKGKKETLVEVSLMSSADDKFQDSTIRVQVGILDNLMNLTGEIVLLRNQVIQYSNHMDDLELTRLSQRLDLITSDLQAQVMKTRMQPIGNITSKLERLTRDLAKSLGKQIELAVQGKETELDKALLEAIKDPLTHIIRNSCDHGIETPDERTKVSKSSTGHILIAAFHEGGQMIIEVSDDGRGLCCKKILKKAVDKGLIDPEKASNLSSQEIFNLIFLPGFSTAEQVSSVSGRGVGMDVVRTNIEKIGGSVDLECIEGKGTTIRLCIPLTLAIIPAVLIKSDQNTYAIPQVKLVELVRVEVDADEKNRNLQFLHGKPVYELRGKLLPLVDLKQVLNTHLRNQKANAINIVVLNTEHNQFGLIVDEVLDTADIVVKPISKFLKSLEVYSGATILGSGEVSLIIDPTGLAKVASLSLSQNKLQAHIAPQRAIHTKETRHADEYLLFTTHAPGKYALSLSMVSRLEEISESQVEYSGGRSVIQYRNAILPLIDTNKALGFQKQSESKRELIPTIVVQIHGKRIGLMVNSILDVIKTDTLIDHSIKEDSRTLGSFIYEKEVVTVIDLLNLIEMELGPSLSKPD